MTPTTYHTHQSTNQLIPEYKIEFRDRYLQPLHLIESRKVLGIQRYWERNLNGHCLLFRQKTFFIHSKLGQMSISFKMLSKNTLMGFSMIVN